MAQSLSKSRKAAILNAKKQATTCLLPRRLDFYSIDSKSFVCMELCTCHHTRYNKNKNKNKNRKQNTKDIHSFALMAHVSGIYTINQIKVATNSSRAWCALIF